MLMNKPEQELMYQVISSKNIIEDEIITTYGISCSEGETIFDISTDIKAVNAMVDLFNKNHLSPIHFNYDLVGDFLC